MQETILNFIYLEKFLLYGIFKKATFNNIDNEKYIDICINFYKYYNMCFSIQYL